MDLVCNVEREVDGRWLADFPSLTGVSVYGETPSEAVQKAYALATEVLWERVQELATERAQLRNQLAAATLPNGKSEVPDGT